MNHTAKGFLVVGEPMIIQKICYHGVSTDAWPIGTQFKTKTAVDICETSYWDLNYPLLIDFDSALDYCHRCENLGITPRMLFCQTMLTNSEHTLPKFEIPQNTIHLGYDYAYPSGSYYSAIANDILYQENRVSPFWKQRINEFGLFSTENDLLQFATDRTAAQKEAEARGQMQLFEKGNFVGFQVFLVDYS